MLFKHIKNKLYWKMAAVFAITGLAAGILFLADNSRSLPENESGLPALERNRPGSGNREEELEVRMGEIRETVTVQIDEEQLTKDELQKEFEKAKHELEILILGDNSSLDEIRNNLNLITKLPESSITVTWELSNYKVMNLQGQLLPDALDENGTLVKLDAFLTYKDSKAQHTFYANVFPPKLSKEEAFLKKLQDELARLNTETIESREMPLPDKVDETAVSWKYVTDFRSVGLFLLGIALSLSLYASNRQKEKQAEEIRRRQLELDYPQIINRFTLYLGAGMPIRKVWFKLAENYQNRESSKETRAVYEEMLYTMHEIQSGTSEYECYEKFGERCGLTVYRKFGTLLSQNMKKGTKGLAQLLKQEAANTFEERKSMARKLGEEAGTKLLLPMFLMFGMVLAIIVIPAFFSMQL